MTYLFDVNALMALFDPRHVHHEAVHNWFGLRGLGQSGGEHGWATCPLTENGFARIVSNPAHPGVRLLPGEALLHLTRELKASPTHRFWPASLSLTDPHYFVPKSIHGHNQLTDVYLLGLCKHHCGKLATFDRRISTDAIVEGKGLTEFL